MNEREKWKSEKENNMNDERIKLHANQMQVD